MLYISGQASRLEILFKKPICDLETLRVFWSLLADTESIPKRWDLEFKRALTLRSDLGNASRCEKPPTGFAAIFESKVPSKRNPPNGILSRSLSRNSSSWNKQASSGWSSKFGTPIRTVRELQAQTSEPRLPSGMCTSSDLRCTFLAFPRLNGQDAKFLNWIFSLNESFRI